MPILEFFQRMLGRTTKLEVGSNAEFPRDAQEATKIVSEYGDLMVCKSGMVQDIKDLPYPKDKIKVAIIMMLNLITDLKVREHLRTGYLTLATYQPDTQQDLDAVGAEMTKLQQELDAQVS